MKNTGLMNELVDYVDQAFHPVSSDELVNHTVYLGYKPKQARGAVGTARRTNQLQVAYTVRIKGRKINFFSTGGAL